MSCAIKYLPDSQYIHSMFAVLVYARYTVYDGLFLINNIQLYIIHHDYISD